MKIQGNCRGRDVRICPFFKEGEHSGFTGKSGSSTWSFCKYHSSYIRDLKNCKLIRGAWRNEWEKYWTKIRKQEQAEELFTKKDKNTEILDKAVYSSIDELRSEYEEKLKEIDKNFKHDGKGSKLRMNYSLMLFVLRVLEKKIKEKVVDIQ